MRGLAASLIALLLLAPAANAQIRTEVIAAKPPGGITALMVTGRRAILRNNHRQYFTITMEVGAAEFDEIDAPTAQPRRPDMLPDGAVSAGQEHPRRLADRSHPALPARRHRRCHRSRRAGRRNQPRRHPNFKLTKGAVFEDRLTRLIDMEGDGSDEILVIKSCLDRGASMALFKSTGDGLARIAQSAPIGRANRWLNIAGAADFDGDGKKEIAAVITPHIGGIMSLYEVKDARLAKDGDAFGFSNHASGSRQLGWSAILDVNGDGAPDMVLPNANRVLCAPSDSTAASRS